MPPTLQTQITTLHNTVEELKKERARDNAEFERRLQTVERRPGNIPVSASEPDVHASLEEVRTETVRDIAQLERRMRALEERSSTAAAAALAASAPKQPDRSEWQEATADLQRRLQALEDQRRAQGPWQPVDSPRPAPIGADEPGEPEDRPDDRLADPPAVFPGDQLEHPLGRSTWEAIVLVGMPQLGRGTSVLLTVVVMLIVVVQLCFCIVLLSSSSFVGSSRFKEKLESSKRWRFTEAHLAENRDPSGTSLAARVCADDQFLEGNAQVELLREINRYVGLEPGELSAGAAGAGPVLCVACLFLISVLVLRELRRMATSLFAAAAIQRGDTKVEGGEFVAMSTARFACFLGMCMVRAGIAVVLLIASILWLSSTTSVTDLLFVTAALGFVIDIDKIFVETLVPAQAFSFASSLRPVPYRRPRCHLEALVPLLVAVIVVIIADLVAVVPNTQNMLDVKEVLCGGQQDFVTARSPLGWVVTRVTTPFASGSFVAGEDLVSMAAQEFRNSGSSTAPLFSEVLLTEADFTRALQSTTTSLSEMMVCNRDTYTGGSLPFANSSFIHLALRQSTGLNKGISSLEVPWTCTPLRSWCDDNDQSLLRSQCPATCGCTEPKKGLLLAKPVWGCPTDCQDEYHQDIVDRGCEDQDVAGDEGWARYWDQYATFVSGTVPLAYGEPLRQLARDMIAGSCANLPSSPDINFCDEEDPGLKRYNLASMLAFCPQTCCQRPNPPAACAEIC